MRTKKVGDLHRKTRTNHIKHEIEASAGGAVAGAALGAFAGPPGAIAGAILGATAGALADYQVEHDAASRAEDDQALDGEIGVSGGEMGAPNLAHPPAKVGAYSGASAGAESVVDDEPAEGPFQKPSC